MNMKMNFLRIIFFLMISSSLQSAEQKDAQKNGVVSKIQMIPTASYIYMHTRNGCFSRQGMVWCSLPEGRCRKGHELLQENAVAQLPGNCLVAVYDRSRKQIADFVAQEELVRDQARIIIDPHCLPQVTSVYLGRNVRRKNEIEARCYLNDRLLTIYPISNLYQGLSKPVENLVRKELINSLGKAYDFSQAEIYDKIDHKYN